MKRVLNLFGLSLVITITIFIYYYLQINYLHIQPSVKVVAIYNLFVLLPILFLYTKFIEKLSTLDAFKISFYIFGVIAIVNFIIG